MSDCTITNNKPMINENLMPMENYTAIVTVTTDSIDHAEEVFRERIGYDEDLGFDYTIGCDDPQPEKFTRGIIIDASVIREKLGYLVDVLDNDEPNDTRILNAYERIKSMDDGHLNALISSINDERAWELFNEVCDRVLDWIIDDVNSDTSDS